MEAEAGWGGSGGWNGGSRLPVAEWELAIPGAFPLGCSWGFGAGRLSPTLHPRADPGAFGPGLDLPRAVAERCPRLPPATQVGCCARGVTPGVLGRVGVPIPQPETRFSKWSLSLPLLLSAAPRAGAWPGLAFQTPGSGSGSSSGSGSVGVWLAGPNFMSLLDEGPLAPWGLGTLASLSLSPCLPDTPGPLSLCLWSFGSLSLSLLPSVSTCSVLTEVGKCRQRCQPPKKPFPRCCLLLWSRLGQGRAGGSPFTLLRAGTCVVDSAPPPPQLPAPPASVWTSSRVSGSLT